jgi:hypothetical protein
MLAAWLAVGTAQTQPVNTAPSRQTLEEVSRDSCEGVSVVVQRCVPQPAANQGQGDDALARSRAQTKAAFDRRDRRARQDALADKKDASATASSDDAQRLAPVIVTGKADETPPTIEEVLQRALNPQVVSPNGTVTTYGADGTRTECVAHCVGPMCCLTLRNRPDPARESNSIGR